MKALQKETLPEQIAQRLKEYILDNRLKPGDRLPTEAELTEVFGVSRSSVREAMKLLQVSGVIDVKSGRGAVINSFDASAAFEQLSWGLSLVSDTDIFLELLEARRLLELMIAPLVMERMEEEHLSKLGNWLDRMENATSVEEYRVLDLEFHKTLIEAAHNRPLAQMGTVILEFFEKVRSCFYKIGPHSSEEHKAIYARCKNRDHKLQRTTAIHLNRYEEWIRQTWRMAV